MSVILSTELASRIEERIRSIIADESSGNLRVRELVQKIGALPLTSDSGGGLSLAPNGDVIGFFWDRSEVDVEHDPRLINMALCQGSRKYPELESVVPSRPPDAAECPYCKGTGYPIAALESGIENIVCYCGGLGWIPAGDGSGNSSLATDKGHEDAVSFPEA